MHFARSLGASVRGALRLRPLVLAAMAAIASSSALAGAVIYNNVNPAAATLALGVNDAGHLNFSGSGAPQNASAYGLSYRFPDGNFYDATAPGCLCEGWGVAVTLASGNTVSGYANTDSGDGSAGLTGGTFSSTATRATSQIGLAGAPIVVTHAYGVSLSSSLFQANVTITNTGSAAVSDVIYRRVMDWDVPNTEFSEYVTHSGVAANLTSNGGNVLFASNNGFASSDPLSGPGEITIGGGGEGGGGEIGDVPVASLLAIGATTINTDFVDAGAADHGSVFDFSFGALAAGESRSFNIFYGAAANEAAALAAIGVVNPTVYSLGQSSASGGGPNDDAPTFIFAFGGVGGVAPGSNPENPLLPLVDTGTGVMTFDAPAPRLWYDPPFAKGYTYTLEGGGAFKKVGITSGFGDLTIRLPDGTLITLPSSSTYDFEANGLAPTRFDIIGLNIDVGAPGYDPSTAFPTFLDFDGSPTRLLMSPIIESGGTVPIPGTALLVVTGLGLMGAARRRKAAQ